jgi:iron complex outermembrane receptor protein
MWIAALLLLQTAVFAQHSIKGKVLDKESKTALSGANLKLILPENDKQKGASTDAEGNFEFDNIASGNYKLSVSFVGYEGFELNLKVKKDLELTIDLVLKTIGLGEVVVNATRASDKTPTTFTNVDAETIRKQNLGQDLPFLLNWTPSVVTTSDAGAGIGYTGIRIRGSDATRINVTINGIPINDSESQGVFWVNMPDFASSTENVQIQRGVGTSTNGAGAFGASVNLLTNDLKQDAQADVNTSFGSFNTQKFTANYATGLLNDKWDFEGRLSKITSDGFIDRAASDLTSYYLSAGYYGKKSVLKFVTFAGKEKTYQSWWGTPEARLNNDAAGIEEVISNNGYSPEQADNLRNSGRTFNYYLYDNQVDDYGQDHYQLHFSNQINDFWSLNASLHYTKGSGFFEEYKEDEDFADYLLDDVVIGGATISSTDLIRRRWLDNDFYGVTYSLNFDKDKISGTLGGAFNQYDGRHMGEVIWAQYASNGSIRHRFYESTSDKTDFNTFLKMNYQANSKLNLYGDLQLRTVSYSGIGTDNDLRPIYFDNDYTFFNPKFGATYDLNSVSNIYGSFAIGNKEPNRSDIIDAIPGTEPTHETLNNIELGYRYSNQNMAIQVNYYLMNYNNQLVLTGDVNDVGDGIRTNVSDSYRTGIEAQVGTALSRNIRWDVNATFSTNKINRFEEVIFDYGVNFDEYNEVRTTFEDTDIAFSPSLIFGSHLTFNPIEGLGLSLLSKYVGEQFLDNTSNDARKINAFFVNDIRINYAFKAKSFKRVELSLLVNNILDEQYESNGYTFGYFGGPDYEVRENYYYPQAGTNFLLALGLKF